MANWISSKLKAAETILQQIDQQAAESLRKDDKPETHEEVFETSSKSSSPVSLKDQLRKKTYDGSDSGGGSQRNSTEQKPSYLSSSKNLRKSDQSREKTTSSPLQSLKQEKPTTLTDADWTELLSAPSNQGTSTPKPRTPRGASVIRGLKKDVKRQGNGGKSPSVSDAKRSEKTSTKAVAVIKERENMVARLEGEKESLEKVVEERAKQQAQEAAELQTNMMETLEAADLEKQKHNNTRMEVFSRLAGLEAANAELTRSLAAGQKKLEAQIDQVAVLREQVELKESALEGLKRKTSNIRGSGNLVNKLDASRGDMFEHQMLEAEISLLTDKIGWLQDKANKLEADINTMRKELEEPTEVEIELKRRLDQLTDHLIQKQSQVEALSSEKATISFRIEAVSRLIEENKGMSATEASSQDLEAGEWKLSGSKFKPAFQDKIRSGKRHLGWLVMQLNAIFVSGTVFLRRNPTAKVWALVYLVCLHLWVLYILLSHSSDSSSSELRSGAVISLENFNNSSLQ
ncbi:BnaC05g13960D [Brassica napus]|uniref:BnaC05g13960D protein n=1 Tax=Brassica napus TaxID=3708 RepID=A0A078FXR9_BRANA|nr:BnaC05g13960D [Brassica napus]